MPARDARPFLAGNGKRPFWCSLRAQQKPVSGPSGQLYRAGRERWISRTRFGIHQLETPGNVNFNDLVVLAQNYNTTLPATGSAWFRDSATW